ncbi:MAG TPA: hypothetical protein VGW34_02775 [Allosphingosinicella sp.]|nr:hypothetical protein [Allosphingosinicella sp.]
MATADGEIKDRPAGQVGWLVGLGSVGFAALALAVPLSAGDLIERLGGIALAGLVVTAAAVAIVALIVDRRRRTQGIPPPEPGKIVLTWLVVKFAWILAVGMLGLAGLAARFAGASIHVELFRAFLLTLVTGAGAAIAGNLVWNIYSLRRGGR